MKKIAIFLIALLTSSFIFSQKTYVPDDKFEQALIDLGYDSTLDDSVLTANISGVTALDVDGIGLRYVDGIGIGDLTGIEAFTALSSLDCSENTLTSIDLSKNTSLVYLNLSDNELTSLDLSKNTALEILYANFNELTSIDVRKNTALVDLNLWANNLTSINVRKNTALVYLDLDSNNLTRLDVSKNTALRSLYCYYNNLTYLNMRNGRTSQLYTLDATYNPGLTCIATLDPDYATANWTDDVDAGVTFSLNCGLADFEWVSSALDTIDITASNLADTYTLQWDSSEGGDLVNYLLYATIGVYSAEEILDTTSLSVPITYQEILEGVFEGKPVNGATVRFNVKVTDGVDTLNVLGDDRVLYVNRYKYLSVENESIPTEFALHENYPNPFNPSTTLRFELPEVSNITLTIYNMLGQKVRTYDMKSTPAGHHSLKWNATNNYGDPVGAGVYLYQLQTKDFVKTRKMVLLK